MSDGPTFARIDPGPSNNGANDDNDNDGVDFDTNATDTPIETWRERERRQRTVRSFMMFLLMLMLMDGEEQAQQQRRQRLRGGGKDRHRNIDNISTVENDMELYRARRTQDRSIEEIILNGNHSRVIRLVQRNNGNDFDREIRLWAQEQRNKQTRAIYEQLLKDLVLDQPDGSFVKVLVASSSNNEAITIANDPSKIILDSVSNTREFEAGKTADKLRDAVKKFEEFQDSEHEVWHYPWNATGYYRGEWKIVDRKRASEQGDTSGSKYTLTSTNSASFNQSSSLKEVLSPIEAEGSLLEHLKSQADPLIGVHLLPPKMELIYSINRNTTEGGNITDVTPTKQRRTKTSGDNSAFSLRGSTNTIVEPSSLPMKLSLTKTSGKIIFQLYSKAVPAMKEISLIDGYIKMCNSNTVGYSTGKDILLRVHGVLVHSLGRLSLVANPHSAGRAALLVSDVKGTSLNSSSTQIEESESAVDSLTESEDGRRRLQELLSSTAEMEERIIDDRLLVEIRTQALRIFGTKGNRNVDLLSYKRIQSPADEDNIMNQDLHKEYTLSQQLVEKQDYMMNDSQNAKEDPLGRRRLDGVNNLIDSSSNAGVGKVVDKQSSPKQKLSSIDSRTSDETSHFRYSKHVIPFPFVWDDKEQSLQRNRVPSSIRSMSSQEKSLEINAGSCEFEINMDIQEEKWTVGQWKKLMSKHAEHDYADGNLAAKIKEISSATTSHGEKSREGVQKSKQFKKSSGSSANRNTKSRNQASMEQAWVMTFNGTVSSPNCDFEVSVNSTAIRTDWETTTGKAINYSFYMMTICLTQIILLLRQLLHTQSQSASARVSLLCIGWQTVIDALLCLVHIYLSLAMQPLFTAFASVAFFKLLIFCVIEMKYMAIIIQARNANNGSNSIELLRRQIAMLHLRFYVALMGSTLGFFYSDNYRTLCMLLLYSFWIPQIIHNVVTEAKKPMHPYYVCGMSITRLVAPMYMFANQENFLKEVYPESPINFFMCQLLVLWVGIQTVVLCAQSRFGARFFIPAQFLPPKYDYNRPIPTSLLPSDNEISNPSEQLQREREFPKTKVRSLVYPNRELSSRGGGARNRKEGKRMKEETIMTAETVTEVPKNCSVPCIECVICYNNIDTSDRTSYMIAPCDHIFHKECLMQWMEVKMECPICRHNLPAI